MGSLANWFLQAEAVGYPVMEAPIQSLRASLSEGGRCEEIGRARLVVAGHRVPPMQIEWSRVMLVAGSTPLSTLFRKLLITLILAASLNFSMSLTTQGTSF